ncbi:hypothetical protein KIL84_001164 [Mauremys mutica]|uniref:Uncharacterized protein n=1 Tax=Mauremys mutica TaxID=74926 RepID=A0A9D3WY11_9SAUR|nr:hypothetical protein KIL84_001164 [Mauremys mutica]
MQDHTMSEKGAGSGVWEGGGIAGLAEEREGGEPALHRVNIFPEVSSRISGQKGGRDMKRSGFEERIEAREGAMKDVSEGVHQGREIKLCSKGKAELKEERTKL